MTWLRSWLYPRLWFRWFDLRRRLQGREHAEKSDREMAAEIRMWRRAGEHRLADVIQDAVDHPDYPSTLA